MAQHRNRGQQVRKTKQNKSQPQGGNQKREHDSSRNDRVE
jgi:hypothetical protein